MHITDYHQTMALLPMAECIEVMRDMLHALAGGEGVQYLRTITKLPDHGLFAFMPAYLNDRYFGAKVVSACHGGQGTAQHLGSVLLFSAHSGELLALVDATAVTRQRTAAVSAVATAALANQDASTAAFLGAGVLAQAHLEALLCVRPLKSIRVCDSDAQAARRFVAQAKESYGLAAHVFQTPAETVFGAHIITTTTSSGIPLICLADVMAGVHINAVGACAAHERELSSDLVAGARFFGDTMESVFHESGDFLFPREENLIDASHYLGDIGEVLRGKVQGRQTHEDITIYDGLGLAIEDVAAAAYVYEKIR